MLLLWLGQHLFRWCSFFNEEKPLCLTASNTNRAIKYLLCHELLKAPFDSISYSLAVTRTGVQLYWRLTISAYYSCINAFALLLLTLANDCITKSLFTSQTYLGVFFAYFCDIVLRRCLEKARQNQSASQVTSSKIAFLNSIKKHNLQTFIFV